MSMFPMWSKAPHFVAALLVSAACGQSAQVQTQKSEAEAEVVDGIMQRTTQWADAARRRDAGA